MQSFSNNSQRTIRVSHALVNVHAIQSSTVLSMSIQQLGDTGGFRHVCNDLTLMRDLRTREKPIVLRQLFGDIKVYTTGTVQLDCPKNFGGSTFVSLLDTCYIPDVRITSVFLTYDTK